MSKSAIKALTEAQNIIAKSGVTVDLVGYIADKDVRKNWRNANALAALIIDSAANAFQSENSETFADNCFDDMAEAVTRYIDSNLDDWNQKTAAGLNLVISEQLIRLEYLVAQNMAYEEKIGAEAVISAGRITDVETAHMEAILMNYDFESARHWLMVNGKEKAQRLADESGFTLFQCAAELDAEEGDYYAALSRLRSAVNAAHDAALIIDNAVDEAYPLARQVLLWSFMDEESRRAMLDANHADALKQDEKYQEAIACLSENLIQPLWDGASDTVKAAITRYQRAQAEEGTGTIEPLVVDHAVNVKQHASQSGALQLFWSTLNEYQKEFLLNVAHDEALAADAELASLARFRLPILTQEERSETDLGAAKKAALAELVSGASLEQALGRFVGQLTDRLLAEAIMDPDLPADRRPAYLAEQQRRQSESAGKRGFFDTDSTLSDESLSWLAGQASTEFLRRSLNDPELLPERRKAYTEELQRRADLWATK